MTFKNVSQSAKQFGISYLGGVTLSSKHKKATKYGEMTYTIYLAPANSSGYEVCSMRSEECTDLCLNESGHNRIDSGGITKARITKTKLFFEHREHFVRWMIKEINKYKAKAESMDFDFSVRLNNTSDINPISFYVEEEGIKLNILEVFPDVQFYDYTKVAKRAMLTKLYSNYDITFSYDGHNKDVCIKMLKAGFRVAVVFENVIPETFWGYEVINGDLYDMRYRDDKNVIVGLVFKKVRTKLTKENKFVIQ